MRCTIIPICIERHAGPGNLPIHPSGWYGLCGDSSALNESRSSPSQGEGRTGARGMGQDLRDGVRSKSRRLSGTHGVGVGARRGRFFAGRVTSASYARSDVEVRFGDGAVLRGERAVSDNVPVLHPSLPDRAVWEEAAEAVSGPGGCAELAPALCMVFTGRSLHRLT
jgi:hypothetical protein